MTKQASILKRLSPELVIRYNGHVSLEREGVASQDQGRLFEALSKNPTKLILKLSSSRSKPSTILTLIHIQEALESEATIVTKRIYIRIEALAQFLCLYY